MKFTYRSVLFALIPVFFVSCSTPRFASQVDNTVDFSQYKSLQYFGWSKGTDALMDENDKYVIEHSFGKEFKERDIEVVDFGGDLTVSLFLVLDKEQTRQGYAYHYGGTPFEAYYGFGHMMHYNHLAFRTHEMTYQKGTLIIDVFDTKTKHQIWQGIGRGFIDQDPLSREKKIPGTVAKIMEQFPVKPVK